MRKLYLRRRGLHDGDDDVLTIHMCCTDDDDDDDGAWHLAYLSAHFYLDVRFVLCCFLFFCATRIVIIYTVSHYV